MSEQSRFEIFAVICFLGLIFPGLGKFVGAGCFLLLFVWVACAIVYKCNQEVLDKVQSETALGKLMPDLKSFMAGHDSIKELVPAWVALLMIGLFEFVPIAYMLLNI